MRNSTRTFCTAATITLVSVGSAALAGDRALVIGIDSYPSIGLEDVLSSAADDAERFATFLTDGAGLADDEVSVLIGSDATSGAIMANLVDRLVGETEPGDRVYFYFAGLGSRIVARTGNEPDGLDEVILAYDADALLGKIPERAIADILDIISNRNVTIVIDASFGGGNGFGASTGFGSQPREVVLIDDGEGEAASVSQKSAVTDQDSFSEPPFGTGAQERAVWNAAAPGQFTWETAEGGAFTGFLIEALSTGAADANGNEIVTNAETLTYLRNRSEEWCAADIGCTTSDLGLTPHFSGPVQDPAVAQKAAPADPVVADDPVLVRVEEGPATYQQTLGFVTDLFTPSNSANLEIAIGGTVPLKLGETVSFSASADSPGTLILFDINPNGELAQIFPSELVSDAATWIEAGVTQNVPSALSTNGQPLQIRVSEPVGEGFLLGILVEDDLPRLKAILPENLAGGAIPNAGQYLYEIAQDLLKLQASTTGNSTVKWSATHLPYEIVR